MLMLLVAEILAVVRVAVVNVMVVGVVQKVIGTNMPIVPVVGLCHI